MLRLSSAGISSSETRRTPDTSFGVLVLEEIILLFILAYVRSTANYIFREHNISLEIFLRVLFDKSILAHVYRVHDTQMSLIGMSL